MTTDKIIAAAREARLGSVLCHNSIEGDRVWIEGADWHDELERFYAIAYRAGMERAAEICESRQTPGTGSVAILNGAADAIRAEAHAKNQPESTHDTGNV